MLSGQVKKNSDFAHVMDNINRRLAGWKSELLNRAGRTSLTKSVICSIPIYTMQNLWLPEGVCKDIDSAVRKFYLGWYFL